MSVIHEERRTAIDARVMMAPLAILAGMGVLFMRLWFLQYAGASEIADEASRSTTLTIQHPAPRGVIVDRTGEVLAGIQGQLVVTAIPRIALKDEESMAQIAALLKSDVATVKEKLEDESTSYLPVPISQNISVETATRIAELLSTVPDQKPGKETGLAAYAVQSFPMRTYSHAFEFAHLLGYVKSADADDIKRLGKQLEEGHDSRKPGAYVGKTGIEKTAELMLMGYPSVEEYITDHRRKPLMMENSSQAVPGDKLVLSVNGELQRYAYEQLGSYTGSVVALDPKTGEVLAMVSKPSYDVDGFMKGMSGDEYAKLIDDDSQPLINRSVGMRYAPGSTFKIVDTFAAWMKGLDPFKMHFECTGLIKLPHDTPKKCLGVHGYVGYDHALAASCNSFFGKLAMELNRTDIEKACHLVGLGDRTGVDINGENKGIIPDKFQADRIRKVEKRPYSIGDQLNSGLGQGVVAATPVQMANMIAFVANRGKRFVPHVIHAHMPFGKPEQVIKPQLAEEFKAPPYFWDSLIGALEGVVNNGTARRSYIPGVRMAGKTGSAEVWLPKRDANGNKIKTAKGNDVLYKEEGKTHSWFVAFAPADNPKIAICVMAERAGHGSDVAAPIASQIVRKYMEILSRPPAAKPGQAHQAPDIQVGP